MTTAEATIAMVNRLDEPDLVKVERYVSRLLSKRNRKAKPELKKYTKDEFLKLLDQADEDIKAGRVYTLEEDREYVKQKYGL